MTHTRADAAHSSQLYWVADNVLRPDFPGVERALRDPDGLLAIGGDLSPARLLDAYRRGIFPWYSAGQPVMWWSPNPRCVLEPDNLRINRSLRRTLNRGAFRVTFNQSFNDVIRACAAPRRSGPETWITRAVLRAYTALHEMGHAVSVECRCGADLVGGMYGVVIGRVFFGESMFSRASDASKVALVHLVHELRRKEFRLLDGQVHSPHLQRLGATPMPRPLFISILDHYCPQPAPTEWPVESTLP